MCRTACPNRRCVHAIISGLAVVGLSRMVSWYCTLYVWKLPRRGGGAVTTPNALRVLTGSLLRGSVDVDIPMGESKSASCLYRCLRSTRI